jgi:hypothetical protein
MPTPREYCSELLEQGQRVVSFQSGKPVLKQNVGIKMVTHLVGIVQKLIAILV